MSKRNNVAYIKPEDPKFLQQLKAQIGYQSGPSIDAKVKNYTLFSQSNHISSAVFFVDLLNEYCSVRK